MLHCTWRKIYFTLTLQRTWLMARSVLSKLASHHFIYVVDGCLNVDGLIKNFCCCVFSLSHKVVLMSFHHLLGRINLRLKVLCGVFCVNKQNQCFHSVFSKQVPLTLTCNTDCIYCISFLIKHLQSQINEYLNVKPLASRLHSLC